MSYMTIDHPECRSGEIYLGNFTREDYQRIVWKTKRNGSKSYRADGTPYPYADEDGVKPAFAKKEELINAGVLSH